jgi:hypothetical protein
MVAVETLARVAMASGLRDIEDEAPWKNGKSRAHLAGRAPSVKGEDQRAERRNRDNAYLSTDIALIY